MFTVIFQIRPVLSTGSAFSAPHQLSSRRYLCPTAGAPRHTWSNWCGGISYRHRKRLPLRCFYLDSSLPLPLLRNTSIRQETSVQDILNRKNKQPHYIMSVPDVKRGFRPKGAPESWLSVLITAKGCFFCGFFSFTFTSFAGKICQIEQLFLPGHLQQGILSGVSWLFRPWLRCDNCFFLYGQDLLVFWTFFG